MKSNKKLGDVCIEIYEKLYANAQPKADFHQLMKKGKTVKLNWFMQYYLSDERQEEIIKKICKKYKCDKWDINRIKQEICLGCSPTSVRR